MTGPFAALVLGAVLSATVTSTPVLTFTDPAINESSGLVDLGPLMVTTNDSGGDPLVFVVDREGRTVATTTFTDEVRDVEALAPAGPGAVWVGDIGDNNAVRSSVQVYRVPVGRTSQDVRAPSYELVYPDGPRDAESLLVGPDGQLRIISKSLLGGDVYVAPKVLDPDRPNRLHKGPPVDLYATDAALFPGGGHALVRGYGAAIITTFPGFKTLAEFPLPAQEQGEGASIGANGRIRLSTEGVRSQVLQLRLPAEVRAVLSGKPSPSPAQDGLDEDGIVDSDHASGLEPDWRWIAGGAVGVLALVLLMTRRRR